MKKKKFCFKALLTLAVVLTTAFIFSVNVKVNAAEENIGTVYNQGDNLFSLADLDSLLGDSYRVGDSIDVGRLDFYYTWLDFDDITHVNFESVSQLKVAHIDANRFGLVSEVFLFVSHLDFNPDPFEQEQYFDLHQFATYLNITEDYCRLKVYDGQNDEWFDGWSQNYDAEYSYQLNFYNDLTLLDENYIHDNGVEVGIITINLPDVPDADVIYSQGVAAGRNAVLTNPNDYDLYDYEQLQNNYNVGFTNGYASTQSTINSLTNTIAQKNSIIDGLNEIIDTEGLREQGITFYSLLSNIFNYPIRFITEAFDVNIFGINVGGVLIAIATLSIAFGCFAFLRKFLR